MVLYFIRPPNTKVILPFFNRKFLKSVIIKLIELNVYHYEIQFFIYTKGKTQRLKMAIRDKVNQLQSQHQLQSPLQNHVMQITQVTIVQPGETMAPVTQSATHKHADLMERIARKNHQMVIYHHHRKDMINKANDLTKNHCLNI